MREPCYSLRGLSHAQLDCFASKLMQNPFSLNYLMSSIISTLMYVLERRYVSFYHIVESNSPVARLEFSVGQDLAKAH